jgi:hypothetical protein
MTRHRNDERRHVIIFNYVLIFNASCGSFSRVYVVKGSAHLPNGSAPVANACQKAKDAME